MKKNIDFKRILRYFGKDKDWQIMIVVFAVLFSGLLAFNYYMFWRLEKDIEKPFVGEENYPTIDRGSLREVINILEAKEKSLNAGILIKPDIKDPSL